MALLGNKTISGFIVGSQAGAGNAFGFRENSSPYSLNRNRFAGGINPLAGSPWGHSHPRAWVIPQTDGGLNGKSSATSAGTATGYAGRAMVGTGAGLGAGSANAQAITNAVADGSATGSGDAEAAGAASGVGVGSASTNGEALAGAIINVIISGTATGAGSAVVIATANLIGEGGGAETELSPANLAAAVWNSLSAEHTGAGTMGKKITDVEKNTKLIPGSL